ncbi:unnamed protein product [Larinioides sclopetarius]|uniref:LisH domain-containing protein n=1 Tax=Larinioides sclopetarius TaxID=280406 RepID=A0AAV2B982_9ARAC
MADYYPSEIARLVLGYLKEANCPKAWETFLVESGDLQEHYRLLQSGRSCSTNIEGKSLLEILHEYRCLKATAERNARNEANLNASNSGPSSSNINPNASNSGPSSSNINPNASNSEPSSCNTNPNTSSSENFKTPQKNNAEAFNRFKIHQATQSQATVRFAQGGNRSPQSLQTYLSTPTRAYSSRTPSRLQGVCVTTLNFGTGAERNEGPTSVHRGIIDTPKRHMYTRTPVRETISAQRLCYSEPAKRRPAMLSRMVQTDNQSTSQVVVYNRSGQTSSSHPRLLENTSTENPQQFESSKNSTNYNEDQLDSNKEYRNSSDRTNMGENLNNSRLLLSENNISANTAVVNQTIVFTSTEIRTGEDNESSSTPQYEIEPPPYARAPATDSPRLILSLDRSQLTSLTTPMKDRRQWHEEFASPRRKGTIPRRRLLSESPYPKQMNSNESSIVSIHENESIIEELMANQPFTQRLADNINKVISEDPEASNSTCFPTLQDIQSSDVMIQNIIARAETDSLFNDIISLFGNSRDCDDLNIQESAAETEGDFSITEGTQTNKDVSEQASVIETLASKDGADSSAKRDSAPEKNNKQNAINEPSSQLPASSQAAPVSSESAVYQNAPKATNIEVLEPMLVDNDKSNMTQESSSKDVLSSCMSIIQPDAETQLESCNFQQSGDILNNVNDVQSSASNAIESSTLVSASVSENVTRIDDASTLKPVSIGTPLQVGTQIALSQVASSINQSIPTTQTIVCYPSSSLTNSTMSFIPSNRNIPILPAVQNQSFILNSNFQPSNVLQFSYSPTPTFPVQPLDGFQSKLIVVQQPCAKHATNWTNNNLTNDVIIPVQTVSAENVTQSPIVNLSPIKIPHDYSPSKSFLADVGKFVTVTSETTSKNKKAVKKQSSKFTVKPPPAKDSHGKKKARKPPKKKRRPLFPSSKDPDPSTENEICDNIPVLSIPDPSPNKDESMSAMEILTSITEGKNTQSPLLKAMISSAKILAEKGGRLNSTHVRTLEFSSPQSEEGNKAKPYKNTIEGDGRRSSPRLKQKTSCKSPCCSPSKSTDSAISCKKVHRKCMTKEKVDVTADLVTNAIEKLTAHKAVSSSMSNVVLNAMQDALQAKPAKSKKQDSSSAYDLFERAEVSLSPIKRTPLKCPSSGKKTPLKCSSSGKSTVVPRNQYFPESSGSDSESDNIPLSAIVASKLKGTLKIKETKSSPLKQNNSQKSNVEKEAAKNVVKEMPSANMESVIKQLTNKDAEVSAVVPLMAKSSMLSETAVKKSNSIEKPDASISISKLVSPSKENKSSRKGNSSNTVKSKELDHVQQETSKEAKDAKPSESCSLSEMTGNSPHIPIVLISDEDREMSETGNENIASEVICNTESKSSKKDRKEKRKKKHSPKLISPSKEKNISRKKSKRKYSPASQKSNSPRIGETSEHLLQNKMSDSLTEKNNCKVSLESCAEKEKQHTVCNKKSNTENSDISQELKKKTNIDENNSHPLSNEDINIPSSKNICRTSPNSPMGKMQKNVQKGKWYISSPQKDKEVCNPSSFEKNKNSLGAKKKNRIIDELCDKLRLNAVQNSPRKEGTLKSLTRVDKLSDTIVSNSFEVSANETSLKNILPPETIASVNPVENETLKLASIEILGEEKSTINTKVRNDITLDSETNINSKQFNVGNVPIKSNVKKRVLPPPKKRIRPVPVASPCDGSFSPFSPFSSPAHSVCFDSTLKPNEMSSISRKFSDSEINKNVSCLPELPSPAHVACLDSVSKAKEMSPVTKNIPNKKINETLSSAPEINSPNAVCLESSSKLKEMPSQFPVSVIVARKCSSGKPKAMAEFYKSALPDRENDLPVSPDPMSNSSCTVDTFLPGRNLPSADKYAISPSKGSNLINKISPEKKEIIKLSKKRRLSSTSIKELSDEEGLIKSPSKTETIIENISGTKSAPEIAALSHSSQVQVKDTHVSSSDEEGLIKSPVKKLNCEQKSDQASSQPQKKRKLITGFSPQHENFNSNISDLMKSNVTDNSFSLSGKTVKKHHQEETSPVHHSTSLNKAKLKSSLKRNSNLPIPAGVKIPSKWNNSKINNYSNIITRSEDELRSKGPRRSRPNIKVVGFISPAKTNSSLKRKSEHSSSFPGRTNTYKTLYSERQARRLQLDNRRSSFRQSPNVNNNRSSAHHRRNESERVTSISNYTENEMSLSKETTFRDYSRKKHEHKDIPCKSNKTDCQEDGSHKNLFPYESSYKRNTSKHESHPSSSKVSEKHFDNQDSSRKHKEKEKVVLPEKSNLVKENCDKVSYKNVEVPGKRKRNIPVLEKSDVNLHKQASSKFSADEGKKIITHNSKHILSKEKPISPSNKHKSSSSGKDNLLFETDKMNLSTMPKSPTELSYDKGTELELGTLSEEKRIELRRESQVEHKVPQILSTEQNKPVLEEESDLNYNNKIVDEAVGSISRTSTDQNELDQAVAFITNDEIPESQEPVISSQITADGSKVLDDASDKNSEDFGALVIKQLSKAIGLSVPMQTEDISHLLEKIKEFGLDNITGVFGQKK